MHADCIDRLIKSADSEDKLHQAATSCRIRAPMLRCLQIVSEENAAVIHYSFKNCWELQMRTI